MTLFIEDVVERTDGSLELGIVARTWQEQPSYDEIDMPLDDPLMRPLVKGEIGIQSHPTGKREIIQESSLRLVDRCMFLRGDVCKRTSNDDPQSGVVLNVNVQVKIRHAITKDTTDGWFDREEFDPQQPLMPGDFVFAQNWVGQVEETFNEALMVTPSNQIQPLYELGGRFAVGEKCYPISDGQTMTKEPTDLIIKVTPVAAAISWSAVNQMLTPSEAMECARPDKFWPADRFNDLSAMRSRGAVVGTIGERVVFKDPRRLHQLNIGTAVYTKDPNTTIVVDALVVTETRTRVEVLWQDGSREWIRSTQLVPHFAVDEYECWPGDFVLWKGEDEKKLAIVQSISAKDRIGTVCWLPTRVIEDISVLELDPHGTADGINAFGLRRGECVLIHRVGTTNGIQPPLLPKVGELENWVHELPNRGKDGAVEGWRGELTSLAMDTLGFEWKKGTNVPPVTLPMDTELVGHSLNILPGGERGNIDTTSLGTGKDIDWFGQVMDLTLEGNIIVGLPSGQTVTIPLERCSLYRDFEDYWDGDGDPEVSGADEMDAMYDEENLSEGSWEDMNTEERDDWSHMETDDVSPDAIFTSQHPPGSKMPGAWPSEPPSEDESSEPKDLLLQEMGVISPPSLAKEEESVPNDINTSLTQGTMRTEESNAEDDSNHWARFEMLPQAPVDHAFYTTEPVTQPSKSFVSRLAKEYKVLQSSLPESILVRVYEDRTDLIRCLIIGPSNTPYSDAPFFIDLRCDPNSYPQSPPVAHFLSWTNGNGRVNPNLYEEGKVCLSILGTWAGDRSESWNAARSSLLQVLVSIQGLVLVREPYFCEPSFEKMRGTEEGKLSSRLYSEKAYILSRGFVRRALEVTPQGLEEDITWFYRQRGYLDKVIKDAESLIARSSASSHLGEEDEDLDLAVPRLSAGGILSLRKTLNKLRELRTTRSEA